MTCAPSNADFKADRLRVRQRREARRGRLDSARFDRIAGEIARVSRLAFEAGDIGSLFGLEGPLRSTVRADLCLAGWTWTDADAMARQLLDEAFRRARAVRPNWYEGQPEWTIREGLLIERTRCVKCGKPLPEGHKKYCSHLCAFAHRKRMETIRKGSEETAIRIATRLI